MSKRHASGELNLLAQISGVAKALSFEAWALTSMKKNSYLKSLCHGFLGHVVIKNKKLLVNDKITALYQTNMTPKHYIKRCKQQKWKTVISFCTCIMYLTTGFNIFSCFDQLLFSFTQIGGSFHCLKFDNFHDTAPLIK